MEMRVLFLRNRYISHEADTVQPTRTGSSIQSAARPYAALRARIADKRNRPMPLEFSVGPQFRTEEPGVCKREAPSICSAAELAEFEPENHVQLQMVQSLAMLNWRKIRIWAIQHAAVSGEIRNQEPNPPELLDRDMAYRAYAAYKQMHPERQCLQLLHRYEVSFQRQYQAIRRDLLAAKARGANSVRT